MKLTKLIKKIIKEQSDVLHKYSYCQSMPPGYTQSNLTNIILNQSPHAIYGGLGYQAGLIGPIEAPNQTNNNNTFTADHLINNNNVIHNNWGSPSPGQVVKMQTCPPSNPNCTISCMKYEGTESTKMLYTSESDPIISSPFDMSFGGKRIYTFNAASNLGMPGFEFGAMGTYNSCDECAGIEPTDPTDVLTPNKAKVIKPTKDKMINPVKDRMQQLANIKPSEDETKKTS